MDNNRQTAVDRAAEAFDLLVQLDEERIRKYEEITSACERLNAENESLRRKIDIAESTAIEAGRKAASAEARYESSRGEIDRLRVEIEARDTRNKRTEKQIGDVQIERDSLKVRLEAKEQELSETCGRFEALTDAMNERIRLASERGALRRSSVPALAAIALPVAAIAPPSDAVVVEAGESRPTAVRTPPAASADSEASPSDLDRELEATFGNWSDEDFASEIEGTTLAGADEQDDARAKSILDTFGGIFGGRGKTASGA